MKNTHVYILLNKPKNVVTTTSDEKGRKTVIDYAQKITHEKIFPVGRLDRNTTGLLLITNDGMLANHLMHPSYHIEKIYRAEIDKPIHKNDFQRLLDGIQLEDGWATFDEAAVVDNSHTVIGIKIHEGRNRLIRRTFEAIGYDVTKLDRVKLGPLTKHKLARGEARHLTTKEIRALKSGLPMSKRGK
mgnify:CR=1 FL=1